jgi:hypothetical protein
MPPRTDWWGKPKASTRTAKKAAKPKVSTSKQKAAPKAKATRKPGERVYRIQPDGPPPKRKTKAQKPLSLGAKIQAQQEARDRAYDRMRGDDRPRATKGDTWDGGPFSRRTSKEGRAQP